MAEMSDSPWQRIAAAPPISAARAICAIVSGWRMGSPGYACTETIKRPRSEAIKGCVMVFFLPRLALRPLVLT